MGPLHGLPVSLKDNFNIAGKDSTVGFSSLVGKPAPYNATLVEVLEKAGAVRYVKTNVPTAMMIAESVNNVFGRTVNPLNRNLTSGGSSGGESALIAFGGSPLGVGTDIVRLRCMFDRKHIANAISRVAVFVYQRPARAFSHFVLHSDVSRRKGVPQVWQDKRQ